MNVCLNCNLAKKLQFLLTDVLWFALQEFELYKRMSLYVFPIENHLQFGCWGCGACRTIHLCKILFVCQFAVSGLVTHSVKTVQLNVAADEIGKFFLVA